MFEATWLTLRVFIENLPISKESQIICTYNLEANCFFVKCLSWLLEMGGYGFKSCSWSHLDCASSGGLHFISTFHVFHFYCQYSHFHLVEPCTLHFTRLIINFHRNTSKHLKIEFLSRSRSSRNHIFYNTVLLTVDPDLLFTRAKEGVPRGIKNNLKSLCFATLHSSFPVDQKSLSAFSWWDERIIWCLSDHCVCLLQFNHCAAFVLHSIRIHYLYYILYHNIMIKQLSVRKVIMLLVHALFWCTVS